MASEKAIRLCLHALERKGLLCRKKGAHEDFDSSDERVRANILKDTLLDWFEAFEDVDDEDLGEAFKRWNSSKESAWYPVPGVVRDKLPQPQAAPDIADAAEPPLDVQGFAQWRPRRRLVWPGRPATTEDLQRWPEILTSLKRTSDPELGLVTSHSRVLFVEMWLRPIPVRLFGESLVLEPWSRGATWAQQTMAVLCGAVQGVPVHVTLDEVAAAAGCAFAVQHLEERGVPQIGGRRLGASPTSGRRMGRQKTTHR